jgi:hypothetical protein
LFRPKQEDAKESVICGGQYISLYHKRKEGHLRCEFLSNVPHLKPCPLTSSGLIEPQSCGMLWQIEHVQNTNGNVVKSESLIRLKHQVTHEYLTLLEDNSS